MIEPVIDLRVVKDTKVFNGASYPENYAYLPVHAYLCSSEERRSLQRKRLNALDWMKKNVR